MPAPPESAAALLDKAVDLHRAGDLAAAEKIYTDVLAADAKNANALYLIGTIRHQQARYAEAGNLLSRALSLDPKLAAAHNNLGKVYDVLGRWDEAITCFQQALALDPNDSGALCNLGIAEAWRGNSAAGEKALRRSIALNPRSAPAVSGLGYILFHQGRTEEAVAAWNEAAKLDPGFVEAHINLGTAYLSQMKFLPGWREFAWRDRLPDSRIEKGRYPQRRWRGEDLTRQKLLLVGEQGLGDQILGAHAIPFLLGRGIGLTIECEPRLTALFERSFPGAVVVATAKPPYPATQDPAIAARGDFFDAAATLIRSPTSFTPHDGYLKPDPDKVAAMRAHLQADAPGQRLVGISWKSTRVRLGPAKTSGLGRDWSLILSTSGNRFVSLQYGKVDSDIAEVKNTGVEIAQMPGLDVTRDIDGLAALTAAMDMVITVSNTTAHLAGALAVPVWTIVPAGPGRLWYWFENRTDSPWYPSMRLFRQETFGVWPQVMAQVADALKARPPAPKQGG